jgi:hypothetical protein
MPEQRDDRGRFAQGNCGGPGRPRRAVERDYLAALADAVSIDRWRAIVDRAVEDASQGDAKARQWISEYLTGKPTGDGLAQLANAEARADDPLARAADEATARMNAKLLELAADF